ncbi:MAG: polymorphic toxin type 50 domain-containing protein [Candidatus Caenarcaniphilales bacterium]|nr:polymorphic toxin type 50 domain-containing protein [Candidatus Caenarcaniphilales bacterium]
MALLSIFSFQSLGVLTAPLPTDLPRDYSVQAGTVTFDTSVPNTLNATSSTAKSIVNFGSLSIGSDSTFNIFQPNSQSAFLGRDIGGNPTEIFGHLNSNGNVFLINPNGILFGAGSQINVNGLLASTLDISNSNFLNGNYIFNRLNGQAPGSVINNGTIDSNNFTAFLAGAVANSGDITSKTVGFGVGDKITLSLGNNILTELTVNEALKEKAAGFNTAISNSGTIDSKFTEFEAFVSKSLYDSMVNNSGTIIAKDLANGNGSFELVTHSLVSETNLKDVVNDNGTPNNTTDDFTEQVSKTTETKIVDGKNLNSGSIKSDSFVAFTGELENSGSIINKSLFDFYGSLFNKGSNSSIKTGSFKFIGDWLWNQGTIESLGNINIIANGSKTALVDIADGRHFYSGPNGTIFVYSGPSFNFYGNWGYLQIMQGVTTPGKENLTFSLLNDGGSLLSGGKIDLTGKDIRNSGGLIEAAGDINIEASNSFVNESKLGFDFINSPDPGPWGTPRAGSAEYGNFNFVSIWTAPGNNERSDNAGVSYYQGYWGAPLDNAAFLEAFGGPLLSEPFQKTVLLFGSETWTDKVNSLGLISAGNNLTINAPELANKAGLLEAANDITITGKNFNNEQAIFNSTTHYANTTSTQVPLFGNGADSENRSIVDAWTHNTPTSTSSTVEAGNNLSITLTGNMNSSGDTVAGNNLYIKSQNLNIGLPAGTVTPPSKSLPGQITLSGLSDSELGRSLRSELFRTVGRSHYTNEWKSAKDSLDELKANAKTILAEHPDWLWGKALNDEQLAQVDEPFLWYVTNEDGSGEYVVYFPLDYDGITTDSTGTVLAENVTLDVQNRFQNRGKIKAYEDVYIEAGSIFNERPVANVYRTISGDKKYGNSGFLTLQDGGEISGKNTTLIADGDIHNKGGLIEGESKLTITAGGNVVNEAQVSEGLLTWDSKESGTFYSKPKEYNAGTLASGGELNITAEEKISNIASDIVAKDNINLTAKKGIENKWLASEHLTLSQKTTKKGFLSKKTTYEEQYGHSMRGASIYSEDGDVNIKVGETVENPDGTSKFVAGGRFDNIASDIATPNGSINITAGDVKISDATIQSTNLFKQKTGGFSFSGGMPSVGSSKTKTQYTTTSQQGSNLVAGEDIDITSPASLTGGAQNSGNIRITGSNLIAEGDINLTADNRIDIEKGKFTDTMNSKSSGWSVGLGAGTINFTAFKGKAKGSYDTLTPSLVLGDNVNIDAGKAAKIDTSIVAAEDKIAVTSPKLDIVGDYQRNDYESKMQSVGVTVALPGPSMGAGLAASIATQVVNNLVPGGVGGGSGSVSMSYSQSKSYDRSGQFVESELSGKSISFNDKSIIGSGANIDGAIINGQEINPNNHQDYSDSGSSSFGFGVGTNGISGSVGSGDFSFGAGVGKSNFVSFGFEDYSLGAGVSENGTSVFGSAHGVGVSFNNNHGSNSGWSAGANYGMFAGGFGVEANGSKNASLTVGTWTGVHEFASKGNPVPSEETNQRVDSINKASEKIQNSDLPEEQKTSLVNNLNEAKTMELVYGTDNAQEVSNAYTSAVLYEIHETETIKIGGTSLTEIVLDLGELNTSTGSLNAEYKGTGKSMFDSGGGGAGGLGGSRFQIGRGSGNGLTSVSRGGGNFSSNQSLKIHWGQQGKHIPGNNNYIPGRSTLTADPEYLVNGINRGVYHTVRMNERGQSIVDFQQPIGVHSGTGQLTKYGTIHSGQNGIHIVPANPIQYTK